MAVGLHGGFRHSRPPEGDDFHLSGRYRDRGITEHKSGDRHSAPAGCFCVELLEVIKKFNRQINKETNQTTGIPVFRMSMCKKCRKHCLSHTKAMDTLSAKN